MRLTRRCVICYHGKMIENLLKYQAKDKERLALLQGVEGGKVKRDIAAAERTNNDARNQLLNLESEAKNLNSMFESISKNLKELLERVEKLVKAGQPKTEDEIKSAITYIETILSKINQIENQLENIGKTISQKTRLFEDVKTNVAKAQSVIRTLTPQYQAQLSQIRPRLDEIEKELVKIGGTVDKTLLEKYKSRRRTEPMGKISDIVVPVANGRCGACFFELPLSLIHKISTDGYIICEECGKIIYK